MIDIEGFMHDWTYFGVNGLGTITYINIELIFYTNLKRSLYYDLTYRFCGLDNIIKRL